jgi:hypothetical protein
VTAEGVSGPFEISALDGEYAICRLDPADPIPEWVLAGSGLAAIVRTAKELSIVCAQARVPSGVQASPGWHALEVHGPLPLDMVGVVARMTGALASHGISVLVVATYDTDYLLVRAKDFGRAVRALRHDGHTVHTPGSV